jgi:hypothetical protein
LAGKRGHLTSVENTVEGTFKDLVILIGIQGQSQLRLVKILFRKKYGNHIVVNSHQGFRNLK